MNRSTPDRGSLTRLVALNARVLLVLTALAAALAGCQRGGKSATTSAAGAPSTGGAAPAGADDSSGAGSPTATSTAATSTGAATMSAPGCPEAEATKTYVRAMSAHAEGNTVVVTAHPARRVCGGPDNGYFEVKHAKERLTLTASATVIMLPTPPRGLGHETVAPTDLPQRLVDDQFGRIFLVRGPLTAVTSFKEQYHP